jgi:2,5-furandicarboxylate decarboxylase 1
VTVNPIDFEKFRLRRFVEKLIELGEVVVHDDPVPLSELSARIDDTPKASLFRNVGAEGYEIVGAVAGSRRRLAAAFGVTEPQLIAEYVRRMSNPQKIIEVRSEDAPVHEGVNTGSDINLLELPFHLQHEFDGAPYISSGIDYSVDPATGKTNVGCRRLMFRSRTTMRANLSQPSDLKRIYLACVARGEKLPASFVIGSHPLDYVAAGLRLPVDEFGLVATLRGEPVPMVRGITNGVLAPADAEMIIEGYFDELGYREKEGPYGEFYGFYGPVHMDPVFHVTAITRRKDVLHQTVRHSGKHLSWTESANLGGLNAELQMWRLLRTANIEPAAISAVPAANGRQHARVALKRGVPGQARLAIAALFSIQRLKHVYIVDDDVDVFSSEQIEWAMSARFRGDRDLVVGEKFPPFYMDPTAGEVGDVAKLGFDLTAPYGVAETIERRRAFAPRFPAEGGTARFASVREALHAGPMFFMQLMTALGSTDGREIALELDALSEAGVLRRMPDGEWALDEKS